MRTAPDATARHDYTPLTDRMNALFGLRVVMAGFVIIWAWIRPDVSAVPIDALLGLTVAYLAASIVLEASRRHSGRRGLSVITGLLLADAVYLIGAMYLTGGMGSPIRFLVYLHLVAVSLLASYRTGLKLALWDSLLLLVVLYAQAAQLMPAVDVTPGQAIEFEQMPIVNLVAFWLFALATSVFSAMNERELRQRRADLQSFVDVGARLDDVTDPVRQSNLVLARTRRPVPVPARHRARSGRRSDGRPRVERDPASADGNRPSGCGRRTSARHARDTGSPGDRPRPRSVPDLDHP